MDESEIIAKDAKIAALLLKKDKAGALLLALQNPPVNLKQEIKDANFLIVEKVLATVSDSEISAVLNVLSLEACDVLMKYIFRLMAKASIKVEKNEKSEKNATPTINCGLMLKLHAQVVEKAGLSTIVRAMTDRKQV